MRARRLREGGFSVIIVMIVLIMLVGIAMILIATSRGDVRSSANERETAVAFYAAEAGIAHGKAYMSSMTYDPALKFKALIGVTLPRRTFDYAVPNTNPEIKIPASYEVSFLNNNDQAPDAGGDTDGTIKVRSIGYGPNNAQAVIEVATGLKDTLKVGTGYCAQANPPPSCRGQ